MCESYNFFQNLYNIFQTSQTYFYPAKIHASLSLHLLRLNFNKMNKQHTFTPGKATEISMKRIKAIESNKVKGLEQYAEESNDQPRKFLKTIL
jgi:hypothetical protein